MLHLAPDSVDMAECEPGVRARMEKDPEALTPEGGGVGFGWLARI